MSVLLLWDQDPSYPLPHFGVFMSLCRNVWFLLVRWDGAPFGPSTEATTLSTSVLVGRLISTGVRAGLLMGWSITVQEYNPRYFWKEAEVVNVELSRKTCTLPDGRQKGCSLCILCCLLRCIQFVKFITVLLHFFGFCGAANCTIRESNSRKHIRAARSMLF